MTTGPERCTRLHLLLIILLLSCPLTAQAHGRAYWGDVDTDRQIVFPNTENYITLVTDLHTHSVFSDGHVWPNVRVAEAARDGLDAVAITEHLEYQPHRALVPNPDRNAAFNEARMAAIGTDMIVISGSEITRDAPAGHINAVFLEDANPLLPETGPDSWPVESAVDAANQQGAFVFWNHPWGSPATPNSRTALTDLHRQLITKRQLHGIEIVNGDTYNEEAHQIALDHGLAFVGTSDVHNLIDWDYEIGQGGHRPVTLALVEERSSDSLQEALFALRTVVWFKNLLIGRPGPLNELLEAGLVIEDARHHSSLDVVLLTLGNHTEAQFRLRHVSNQTQSFHRHADIIDIEPHGTVELSLKPVNKLDEVALEFEVMNALTTPNTHPHIVLRSAVSTPVSALGTSFHYEGEPSFTIEYPEGTSAWSLDGADQVFAAATPQGITFQAAVADIPEGVALMDMAQYYVDRNLESGVGSDMKITRNEQIMLRDGTPAYRSEVKWVYGGGIRLNTQMVSAFKNGKAIWVTAHPRSDPEPVSPIVESLRFE